MRVGHMSSLSQPERRLIWIGCLAILASSVVLILWYWPGSLPQDNASGVWTALAQDLARGIFYRPTADVFGFGGTRYMPLFFILHASLIRLSLDPVSAGVTMTLASAALFDLGVLCVLRELGLEWSLAAPLSVLAHAAVAFQVLTLQVKGDFLAGALNLWGVYLGLRYARRPSWPWFAACTLALLGAFLTKFTTVGGAAALCAWMVRSKRPRAAVALAATLGVLYRARAGRSRRSQRWRPAASSRHMPSARRSGSCASHSRIPSFSSCSSRRRFMRSGRSGTGVSASRRSTSSWSPC